MLNLFALIDGINLFGFPLLAIASLFASKLTAGAVGRSVDRCFFALLVLQVVITIRTVIAMDTAWLTHMATLMVLIVGSVVIPSIRFEDDHAGPLKTSL